jgi:FAD:protein FMN transferase
MVTMTGPRTVHVEQCMGTVFTVDIRDAGTWDGPLAAVVDWLHHVDAVFSTYRADSDISRIQRRELALADADPDVAVVLDLCAAAQTATGGHFSALSAGRLDPTGLVKGWAIERASALLRRHGSQNHAVNGGGDVQVAGEAAPDRPWTVGITDPHDRARLLTTVAGRDFAVATSGVAERGHHIVDPFTGRPAVATASATVTGPSLAFADAWATAAVVMGAGAPDRIDGVPGYAALVVAADGTVAASRRWAAGPLCEGR